MRNATKYRAALAAVVDRCITYMHLGAVEELRLNSMLGEYLTPEEQDELEEDPEFGPVWEFLDSFCDAAWHRMPTIREGMTITQGLAALEEIGLRLRSR